MVERLIPLHKPTQVTKQQHFINTDKIGALETNMLQSKVKTNDISQNRKCPIGKLVRNVFVVFCLSLGVTVHLHLL